MTRSRTATAADIEALRMRFEQWRQARQGKARIPDELWSAAVELARGNGINRTASPLRLDGGKLKRLMLAAGAHSRRPVPPKFVELMPPGGLPSVSAVGECTLELECDNRKLRIHCKGASVAELAALTRAVWGLGS